MRHRVYGRKLNRTSPHRRAMFRNLAAGLFEHGRIETTMAKAKAVQPYVEKLITTARRGGFNARRRLESELTDRRIHAWVADPNVRESRKESEYFDLPSADEIEFNRYGELRKAPRLIQHLLTKVAPLFDDRDGGYTRIIKLGRHRLGDGGDLVLLELVGREEGPQISSRRSRRRAAADRRTEYAAKVASAFDMDADEQGTDAPDSSEEAPDEPQAAEPMEQPQPDGEETGNNEEQDETRG